MEEQKMEEQKGYYKRIITGPVVDDSSNLMGSSPIPETKQRKDYLKSINWELRKLNESFNKFLKMIEEDRKK